MERIMKETETEMTTTIKQELEIFYHMSGVFVQMLMYDAEA